MTHTSERDDNPPDLAQTRVVRRLRGLMIFSSLIMIVGFLAVFGVIAYRLSIGAERGRIAESNVSLPEGARVVSTTVSEGKLVVGIEIAGVIEVRIFDLTTLEPRGHMRFITEP